jgi:hypothetical protein
MMKMVNWYDPGQLLKTALKVAVSTIFGRHADYRLLEALGRGPATIYDYTKREDGQTRDEIWIDYVADTGDGWDSTYAVAYYATRAQLAAQAPDGTEHQTERGQILIFGGDEVYPTPTRKEYEQRLVAPYRTALPFTDPPHPHVFAIPGNHDWYDSLVSFTRLFCSKQWFAGWRTPQNLSYFALRLPHGWWLLGTDVQLGSDIDQPQVEYFQRVAQQMSPGDRVILCNAEPHWISAAVYKDYDESVFNENSLTFLESDKVLGRKISLFIAGDLHHYRRHEAADGTHKITAGGGGAFLHPTHGPDVSSLPGGYVLKKSFPDIATSIKLCRRNLLFPILNPRFGILTGFFYLLTAWSAMTNVGVFGIHQFILAVAAAINGALNKPLAVFWGLAVLFGFILFTDTHSKLYRWIMGPIHGMTHVIATFFIGWFATYYGVTVLGLPFRSTRQLLLAGIIIFPAGWIIGSFILRIYLWASLNLFARHGNEAFSSLAIPDWKNFLRLRIDAGGDLTIYPIGIRRVPRKWRHRPAGAGGPAQEPHDRHATAPELIEPPIIIQTHR